MSFSDLTGPSWSPPAPPATLPPTQYSASSAEPPSTSQVSRLTDISTICLRSTTSCTRSRASSTGHCKCVWTEVYIIIATSYCSYIICNSVEKIVFSHLLIMMTEPFFALLYFCLRGNDSRFHLS